MIDNLETNTIHYKGCFLVLSKQTYMLKCKSRSCQRPSLSSIREESGVSNDRRRIKLWKRFTQRSSMKLRSGSITYG